MAKRIPNEIKEAVQKIVTAFNQQYQTNFHISFRGQFAYLAKTTTQQVDIANTFRQMLAAKMGINISSAHQQDTPTVETKLGRLKYNGQMDNWSFAVFRYTREVYDAEEFMFPGAEELDGTIEGALKASIQLYP
ncbi:MAG: hypothetical protein AB8G22_10085 [Saprospiraceae bacterium]